MIMKKHLKIFLSFLSLAALLLGSCSAEDKLGSETQGSQVSGGSIGRRTNLPIWSRYGTYIPEIWWGKYYDLSRAPIAIVTANSISLYGSDGGSFLYTVDVSDSKTTYLGNNTWHYYYDTHNHGDDSTIKFRLNENGQRVLLENPLSYEYTFVHEDDINK